MTDFDLALRGLLEEDPDATARQMFYLAVSHGLENSEAGFAYVCRFLNATRDSDQQF